MGPRRAPRAVRFGLVLASVVLAGGVASAAGPGRSRATRPPAARATSVPRPAAGARQVRALGAVAAGHRAAVRGGRPASFPRPAAAPVRAGGAAPRAGSSGGRARIAFRPGAPGIVGRAVFNGTAAGRFVIDTGASVVSITRTFAGLLGLDLGAAEIVRVATANGAGAARRARVARIDLEGAVADDVEVLVLDDLGGADGLIGLNFLQRFQMSLRPAEGVLELVAP